MEKGQYKKKVEDPVVGFTQFEGKKYDILAFTDESRHCEPCPECVFGSLVSIGMYPHIVKGKIVMKNENGYKCDKPEGFDHCTSIRREDGRNVYFRKHFD